MILRSFEMQSKAFDYIFQIIISKLATYDPFSSEEVTIKIKQKCVKINNICSNFMIIIFGAWQGIIIVPVPYNLSANDIFFYIEKTSIHNFANENSWSAWVQNAFDLIAILESEVVLLSINLPKTKWLSTLTSFRWLLR